jgi:hypothetical protein
MLNATQFNGCQVEPLVNYSNEPDQLTIVQAKANENTGVMKINDHPTDNIWKGQMMLTLEICGVEKNRECHRLMPQVHMGMGMGWSLVTLAQPTPVMWAT